jgi:hypothetical protein
MKKKPRFGNPCSLTALALMGTSFAVVSCGELAPQDAPVAEVQSALSAGAVQSGSGILWHLPNGELHVWDMLDESNLKDLVINNADPGFWTPIATGDFNADGAGDILWRSTNFFLTDWFLTDTRFVSSPTPTGNAPSIVGIPLDPMVGDINGDKIADIVWNGLQDSPATIWLMASGSTTPASISTSTSIDRVLAVSDFDNDTAHKADLLRHRNIDQMVTIAYNQGAETNLQAVDFTWTVAGTGDFNKDGASDILWHNEVSGEVQIWFMKPGAKSILGAKTTGFIAPNLGYSIAGVGDFDHDGIADIMWRHTSGVVVIWKMAADGTLVRGGNALTIPAGASFAGIINLGLPSVPTNILPQPSYTNGGNGQLTTRMRFTLPTQRISDQIEVWEMVGNTGVYKTRLQPTLEFSPNTMRLDVVASTFSAGANPCLQIRSWEQGRVSAFSSTFCLSLPQPVAKLDFTMPARFGLDVNNDKAIDLDLSPTTDTIVSIRSNTWTVHLDACASNDFNAGGAITSYKFTGPGPSGLVQLKPPGPACAVDVLLPGGHDFVTVDVTTADKRTGSFTLDVNVKNTNIVLMGDSFMSGEGNPLQVQPAFWGTAMEANCHRTANTAAARAALALERSDPRSSVTFLSVACTGAIIDNIVSTDTMKGQFSQLPQVLAVKTTLCGQASCPSGIPKIDAIVFDGGINDLGFAGLLERCALLNLVGSQCNGDSVSQEIVTGRMNAMIGALPNFAIVVKSLGAAKFFVGDYPDPGSAGSGTRCTDWNFVNGGPAGINGHIGAADIAWFKTIEDQMNAALRSAFTKTSIAFSFLDFGTPFLGHGYCVGDHWFQQTNESIIHQGNNMGTMHPNDYGHVATGKVLLDAYINAGFGAATATTFFPAQTFVRPTASTARYDVGTQCLGMHCCPTGWAMVGVQAANGAFLKCEAITGTLSGVPTVGGVQRTILGTTMLACPFGSVMVGINNNGAFACQKVLPSGSEIVDSITQDTESNYVMHVCPPGQAMSGLQTAQNKLGCTTGAVVN